jgi:LysR family transcriptional regulator, benzoate and cis,cis-muconate-responsive activator of ben and cat genes
MELRHLRYFVAVARNENISQASKRLHVSQPSLSRQIRDLEDEVGIPLLKRSAKAVELTEAGQVFLAEAEAALQRVEDAVSLTRAIAKRKLNHIRVGHSAASSIEAIPKILGVFQRMHPQAKVELRTLTTQEMLRGLRCGELDICLSVWADLEGLKDLVVEEIGAYSLLVAAPKMHPFAQLRRVPVRDVAKEPVLTLFRSSYPWYNSFIARLLSQHNDSFKFAEEHEHPESVIAAVEAGRGVAIVYDVMARPMAHRVVVRPLTPSPPRAPLVLLYRREGKSPIMDTFIKAARSIKNS